MNIQDIRNQFPILQETVNNHSLVYFDNAASTQKPISVLEAMDHFYRHDYANVHRAVHCLAERATLAYEGVRAKVQRFINAKSSQECIFVRSTTEAINLVAQSFLAPRLLAHEGILLTQMEHHSNIVPWQMVCKKTGASIDVAGISIEGDILLDEFRNKLNEKIKFVAISHVSNALGTINQIKTMIKIAHDAGALVLVDGAQAAPHLPIDVQDLDADFYAFSGHKMYGPTGIGILWGREALLDEMAPYQGGGEMIKKVTFQETEYGPLPYKFEAGTPNIVGAIGLGAAIDFLGSMDQQAIADYESLLLNYATAAIEKLKRFQIIGTAAHKSPIISLVHGTIHAHDIGTILDNEGIAVRAGHHCAMPLMDFYQVPATTRISLSFYNTEAEIDRLVVALQKAQEIFA